MGSKAYVLDKGFIELIDSMGSDLSVDEAARVSTAPFNTDGTKRTKAQMQKLIGYLYEHGHGTPFEHLVYKFHVKCPIVPVARQWMRYRMASYNEASARYRTLQREFYKPDKWHIQGKGNKQTSGEVLPDTMQNELNALYWAVEDACNKFYAAAQKYGVSREQARVANMQGQYTEFIWTVNARSLAHFITERMSQDAQAEIREYAKAALELMKQVSPIVAGVLIDED